MGVRRYFDYYLAITKEPPPHFLTLLWYLSELSFWCYWLKTIISFFAGQRWEPRWMKETTWTISNSREKSLGPNWVIPWALPSSTISDLNSWNRSDFKTFPIAHISRIGNYSRKENMHCKKQQRLLIKINIRSRMFFFIRNQANNTNIQFFFVSGILIIYI